MIQFTANATTFKIRLYPLICVILFQAMTRTVPCCAAPPENRVTLPNGLQVLLRERHEKPLAALDLWIRAGSREERPGEEGCAHFLEHTLFKGTATRKVGELDFALESLGGVFSAATGPDYARFGTVVAPSALEPALALLSDLVRKATLPDSEIERERGPILDELAIHSGNLNALVVDRAYALAFEKHPYRHSPGGTAADIRARTRVELLGFYQRNYAPERAVFALVGDFDSAAAKAAIEKTFGDWKRSETKNDVKDAPVLEPDLTAARSAEMPVSGHAGRIAIGFRVPPAADKAASHALLLLAEALGSSETSGLLSAPVFAGTNATARYTPRLDGGLFLLTADASTGADFTRIENALQDVALNLQTAPLSASTLRAACQQISAQFRLDSETVAGLARRLGYAALTQGDSPEDFARVLPLVKPLDIQKAARLYFQWERRIEIRLLPAQPIQSEVAPVDKN